eukprot:CAMPEP_0182505306 /NCGR_PEP_ID=MMETSP1321-20130603/18984_1 /TAXON_ID=91990 /ORGANISM="Bolidomonas sp., Strain RCC1657" /LENGTH=31 /DNA_ID= /DNA_START= /DNA_END= /DNA_ORIENTATION=
MPFHDFCENDVKVIPLEELSPKMCELTDRLM